MGWSGENSLTSHLEATKILRGQDSRARLDRETTHYGKTKAAFTYSQRLGGGEWTCSRPGGVGSPLDTLPGLREAQRANSWKQTVSHSRTVSHPYCPPPSQSTPSDGLPWTESSSCSRHLAPEDPGLQRARTTRTSGQGRPVPGKGVQAGKGGPGGQAASLRRLFDLRPQGQG